MNGVSIPSSDFPTALTACILRPCPDCLWLRQALTPGKHTRDSPLLAQLATLANACSQLDCILAPAVKECNVYGMQLWWGTSLASRWSSRSATESPKWTSPGSSDVRTGPTSMATNDCDRYCDTPLMMPDERQLGPILRLRRGHPRLGPARSCNTGQMRGLALNGTIVAISLAASDVLPITSSQALHCGMHMCSRH